MRTNLKSNIKRYLHFVKSIQPFMFYITAFYTFHQVLLVFSFTLREELYFRLLILISYNIQTTLKPSTVECLSSYCYCIILLGVSWLLIENKDIFSCNMGEDTVKAFRTVYDGVKHMKCEVHDIPVSKELLKSCKQSRQRYSVFLEDQKKAKKDSEAESNRQGR